MALNPTQNDFSGDFSELNTGLEAIIQERFLTGNGCALDHFEFRDGAWKSCEWWASDEDKADAGLDYLEDRAGITCGDSNHHVCGKGFLFTDENPVIVKITSRFGSDSRAHGRCVCGHEMVIKTA